MSLGITRQYMTAVLPASCNRATHQKVKSDLKTSSSAESSGQSGYPMSSLLINKRKFSDEAARCDRLSVTL